MLGAVRGVGGYIGVWLYIGYSPSSIRPPWKYQYSFYTNVVPRAGVCGGGGAGQDRRVHQFTSISLWVKDKPQL